MPFRRINDYSAFTIARCFKVKSLSLPLHTQWSAPTPWSSAIVLIWHHSGRWERERERVTINYYVRYLQTGPLNGLSSDCHVKLWAVGVRQRGNLATYRFVLDSSRGNENSLTNSSVPIGVPSSLLVVARGTIMVGYVGIFGVFIGVSSFIPFLLNIHSFHASSLHLRLEKNTFVWHIIGV